MYVECDDGWKHRLSTGPTGPTGHHDRPTIAGTLLSERYFLMFRSTFVVTALVLIFAAVALFSLAAVIRAKTVAGGRADAAGAVLVGGAVVAAALGFAPAWQLPLTMVLAAVFLWFAGRTLFQMTTSTPAVVGGPSSSAYHAVLAAIGGWVVFEAARNAGSATGVPGHELGVLLVDLLAAVAMVFAMVGWLLATFTLRAKSGQKALSGLTGGREALVAAGLALALFAVS